MSTAMSSTGRLIFCCDLFALAAVLYQQNADLRLQIKMLTLDIETLKRIVNTVDTKVKDIDDKIRNLQMEDNNFRQMMSDFQYEIRKYPGIPIWDALSRIVGWFVGSSRRLLAYKGM